MKTTQEPPELSRNRKGTLMRMLSRVLILAENRDRGVWLHQRLNAAADEPVTADCLSYRDGLHALVQDEYTMVIMDVSDIGIDPLHHLKQIRLTNPDLFIIMISYLENADLASRALRAGAHAFLTTEEAGSLMRRAMETLAEGERFVSEEVMQGILRGMVEVGSGESRLPIELLSDREMVVFQLIGKGHTFREIADELGVNIKTVATHCNNIRRKLHSRDNRHLTRLCRNWVSDHHPQPDNTDSASSTR